MGSVLEVNADDWEREVLQSDMLTVVDFWHNRCPWCIRFDPIINEVAEEYKDKIKFVKLNVLQNPSNREIAIRHGIMSTPTLLFFCKERSVGQAVGFMPKERLKKILDDMFERHTDCIKQSTELKT
ncbi:MAG: thioredoxin family protein [Candidatus Bathyarchaeota archaeon]|nr:thioredoxin family protein [Candidatus Bathyarchaeota archaeon]